MADQSKESKNADAYKILAVDTATRACSVALADGGGTIAELNYFHGQTHSRHLAGMVEHLLDIAAARMEDLAAFAVDAGPGTFTGLRIGLATIKGLADATQKPAVGVSSLDVLASQAGFSFGHICCMLDARRGEVYTARYAAGDNAVEKLSAEEVLAPHQAVAAGTGPCLYIGSGAVAYRDIISEIAGENARFAKGDANHLRASTVARLGLRQLRTPEAGENTNLVPNYIRRSDAEYNKLR
ncbi:MAG: tRNA (adenosine(37)-N6)-threonylcarbamoyltransferase complex dimerization subunit type 1 TsaB [Desulfobacterales bacterium]|nr:tRNA (adenosine(37)-N6)-threonylcarbamoyltransferase complex dimerization subunit type 1 TsaB [Desulfobacterales bacterium]